MQLLSLAESLPLNSCDFNNSAGYCIERTDLNLALLAKSIGYDFVHCGCHTGTLGNDCEQPGGVFFSNFPKDFEANYMRRYVQIDPVIRYLSDPGAPDYMPYGEWAECRSRAINDPLGATAEEQADYTARVLDLFEECEQAGMRSGVFMQLPVGDLVIQISMANSEAPSEHHKRLSNGTWSQIRVILLMIWDISRKIGNCERCNKVSPNSKRLLPEFTHMQKSIMKVYWTNPMASLKEVAETCNCSVANIKYHLGRIRALLGLDGARGDQLAQYAIRHYYL